MILMELRKKLKNIVTEIDIFDHIKLFMLFGSRSRGDYTQSSDIDIAILLDNNFLNKINPLELRAELISFFSSQLDNECDVILINQANSFLKYQIVKYGKIIYISNDMNYAPFFSKVLKEYFDFRYYKKLHNERMLQRIKKGG